MKNAAQWLDLYKKRAGFRSDYALARYWGVSQSHVSQYRRGRLKLPLAAVLGDSRNAGARSAGNPCIACVSESPSAGQAETGRRVLERLHRRRSRRDVRKQRGRPVVSDAALPLAFAVSHN